MSGCFDYFDEVDRFYAWSMANSPSAAAFVLWHALMHTWCSIGRPESFTIAVKVLSVKTGLEKSAILRARNSLRQLGRIEWFERRGGQSARYRIVTFNEDGAADGSAGGAADGSADGSAGESVRAAIINNGIKTFDDSVDDVNNKGSEKSSGAVADYLKKACGKRLSVRAEARAASFLDEGVEKELIFRAIDASVDAGACNWVYAEKTIENCVKKGIFSLSDYEQAEKKRAEEKARSIAGKSGGVRRKTAFSNFKERESGFCTSSEELARLERERIERELED